MLIQAISPVTAWETRGGRERLIPSRTGPKDLPTAPGYRLQLLSVIKKKLTQNLEFAEIKVLVAVCPGKADLPSVNDTGSTRH